MVEKDDHELVIKAQAGDKEAFGQLFERYQNLARRVALRMLTSEEVAEELCQEALLQAYLAIKTLHQADSFRSWLFGIVLNVCRSYLRDLKRRNQTSLEAVKGDPADLSSLALEDFAVESEVHQLVLSTIQSLPAAYREATLLYYYEMMPVHEVASLVGVSPVLVKVRLHRARNQLREKLVQAYPELEPRSGAKLRRKTMVKASIVDVLLSGDSHIVILKENEGKRVLPIWIGPYEAEQIVIGMLEVPTARPQTFNFISSILDTLNTKLEEVRIEVLKENVFYGVAKLRFGDEVKEVDARPSDILALAVRTGSPIFISEDVLAIGGKQVSEAENNAYLNHEGAQSMLKELQEKIYKATKTD